MIVRLSIAEAVEPADRWATTLILRVWVGFVAVAGAYTLPVEVMIRSLPEAPIVTVVSKVARYCLFRSTCISELLVPE